MSTKSILKLACLSLVFILPSCVFVHNYGPDGFNGRAFFGVDYHFSPPYSYWDNNRSIPYNPALGHFYETLPGLYEFEYFINPTDYWYGTYEIWINFGTAGGPYGEPGLNGLDTYLMLYCDPGGFHEERFDYRDQIEVWKDGDKVIVEKKEGHEQFKIVMQKTTVHERSANIPKYKSTMPESASKVRQ